jgi:hypothetical protein
MANGLTMARPTKLLGLVDPVPRQIGLTGVANATFRNSYSGQVIPNVTYPTITTNNRTGFQGESVGFSPISAIGDAISNIAAFSFQKDAQKRAYEQEIKLEQVRQQGSSSILNSRAVQLGSLGVVLILGAMLFSK